ncbi:ribosome-inactivating protein [Nemania sp. NC0429]|nr:ribosome-inactivating protein [Nemania sp. NC0429]
MPIDFTETLDVNDGEDEYVALIERIRNQLAAGMSSACLAVRHLAPQAESPNNWFDLVLSAGEQRVALGIRSDNLYLDTYRRGDAAPGQWLEFQDAQPATVVGAFTRLSFDGGYRAIERAADISRRDVGLGWNQPTRHVGSTTDFWGIGEIEMTAWSVLHTTRRLPQKTLDVYGEDNFGPFRGPYPGSNVPGGKRHHRLSQSPCIPQSQD